MPTLANIYEAIVYVAAREAISSSGTGNSIEWDEDRIEFKKRPDILIINERGAPIVNIMVTHCKSAKASNFKYLRSLCEFIDVMKPGCQVRTASVIFDDTIKPSILTLYRTSFDGSIVVRDTLKSNFQSFTKSAHSIAKLGGDKVDAVALLDKLDQTLLYECKRVIGAMILDLLSNTNSNSAAPRTRNHRSPPPSNRFTGLKRGLGKLLIAPAGIVRGSISKDDADVFASLGMMAPSAAGENRFIDKDICWALKHVPVDELEFLHLKSPREQMSVFIEPLRNAAKIDRMFELFTSMREALETPEELLRQLIETSSSDYLRNQFGEGFTQPGWLFEICREVIKANIGGRTSWGWAQLIEDLKEYESEIEYWEFIKSVTGFERGSIPSSAWSGYRTITYSLPEWVMGDSRTNFPLKSTDLPRLAFVISRRLIDSPQSIDILAIKENLQKHYLEDKLIQYRHFDPLRDLVEKMLKGAGIDWKYYDRWPSCFVSKASSLGYKLNVRTGTTSVIKAQNTLIAWQCVTDSGRDHKEKELSARSFAISHTWNGSKYTQNADISKLILLLDGTVDQASLGSLSESGWDEIFYPDEVDRLTLSIV